MGIRPSINVVFGIDNLETKNYNIIDSRFSGKVDYEDWDNPIDLPAKGFESAVLQDGYSICKSYKFEEITTGKTIKLVCDYLKEQGKPVFPYLRRILKKQPDIREMYKFCKHGQLYPHHDYIQTRMWIDATQMLFDKIGLKVDDKDLKLMLYWRWGLNV